MEELVPVQDRFVVAALATDLWSSGNVVDVRAHIQEELGLGMMPTEEAVYRLEILTKHETLITKIGEDLITYRKAWCLWEG